MASSSSSSSSPGLNNPAPLLSPPYDPNAAGNTTFVQADPSNFRDVVQRLTGASHDPLTQKLPVTAPARFVGKSASGDLGLRTSAFKLHERRQSARKLEIKLGGGGSAPSESCAGFGWVGSPTGLHRGFPGMPSPVSPLDLFARGSPRTPLSPMEEEERAIAERGFYLHPSPLSTPRGSEPELLTLFPLHSTRVDSSLSS